MINPYLLLAGGAAWALSIAGTAVYFTGVGEDGVIAKQVAVSNAIEETRKAAQEGAAHEIAKIKVVNTTIRGKTETIVRENVVYRECRHTPDGLRVVNEALTGRPERPSDSKLPGVNGVK